MSDKPFYRIQSEEDYQKQYQKSIEQPEKFWEEITRSAGFAILRKPFQM